MRRVIDDFDRKPLPLSRANCGSAGQGHAKFRIERARNAEVAMRIDL
jgi:hypothetical protein